MRHTFARFVAWVICSKKSDTNLFIKKYLVSHFIITFLVIVSLAVIGDYYFLERAMYVYSLIAVAFLFPISVAVALIIVKKGLSSLKEVAEEVANRDPNYLDPMDINHVPEEIKPLVKEINLLLSRLKQGFEREKRFAADAAHELRTPLAALKTQAQVALQATDPEVQKLALEKVIEGVNRSTHLVQQLLTLSRLLMQAETDRKSVV